MPIRDFELYHGALLTKLVRSDRPMTIRIIETDANECWSAYTIDDTATIYTKYRGHGNFYEKDKSVKWTFSFQPRHLDDLRRLSEQNDLYVALVCANHRLDSGVRITLGDPQKEWEDWLDREKHLRKNLTGGLLKKPVCRVSEGSQKAFLFEKCGYLLPLHSDSEVFQQPHRHLFS